MVVHGVDALMSTQETRGVWRARCPENGDVDMVCRRGSRYGQRRCSSPTPRVVVRAALTRPGAASLSPLFRVQGPVKMEPGGELALLIPCSAHGCLDVSHASLPNPRSLSRHVRMGDM